MKADGLDVLLLSFVNQFAGQSPIRDGAVREISSNMLFKGALVAVILNWLWFRGADRSNHRDGIVAALAIACVAILVGRVLALTLPFSLRPLHAPDVALNMSFGLNPATLDGWSSRPSDHAVMFFAIAASVFRIDRLVGMFLLAHAFVIICLPRVYLGLHWPSDVLLGALVGVGVSLLLQPGLIAIVGRRGLVGIWLRREALFYPAFFLVNLLIATMFDPLRSLLEDVGKLFATMAGGR